MSHDIDTLKNLAKHSADQLHARLYHFRRDSKPIIGSWLQSVLMSLIDGVDLKKIDITLVTALKKNTAAFIGALDTVISEAFPRYPKFVDSLDIRKDMYLMFYSVITQYGQVIDQSFLSCCNPWVKAADGTWSYPLLLNSPEFETLYKNSGIKEYYEKIVSVEKLIADIFVIEHRPGNQQIWDSIK